MPTKPETYLYRKVNEALPRLVYRQKVTSLFGNGTPDFWYSGSKADLWVEYKWLHRLSRNGVDPLKLLTPLQVFWINCRYAEGRNVMVVIGSSEGCAILEHGMWNDRVAPAEFRYAPSEVSALLLDRLHDSSAVSKQSRAGHESHVSSDDDLVTDRGDSV